MIEDHDREALSVGDLVDVAAFPEIAGFGPALTGAQVKRLQSGPPPSPVRTTARDLLKGDLDGQLVQIDGMLVDRLARRIEAVLAIESDKVFFEATLPSTATKRSWEAGARLRLTGICWVQTEQFQEVIRPRQFRLLLRSPADVVVLAQPPWLTADRIRPIAAGGVLLIVAGLSWVALLRKRVRDQTSEFRAQTYQLQIAHQGIRSALQKAREAESVDMDSKRVLESVARDEAVERIVDQIAEAVAMHCEGAVCAILLGTSHAQYVSLVPAMPAAWQEALSLIELMSIQASTAIRNLRDFSEDPAWVSFLDTQPNAPFSTCCSSQIVVDGVAAGLIAVFLRNQRNSADAQVPQLELWSNIAALALERRRLYEQLSHRAQHDNLTGLPNRASLYERLEAEIGRASSSGGLVGALYLVWIRPTSKFRQQPGRAVGPSAG